jgi:hypothetical protein
MIILKEYLFKLKIIITITSVEMLVIHLFPNCKQQAKDKAILLTAL